MIDNKLDFEGLAAELLPHARDLVPAWLPGGRMSGHEYVCASLRGGEGRSLSINLETGRWADFAGTEKGGDLISLWAAIEGIKQSEAAKQLAIQIGFQLGKGEDRQPLPAPRVLIGKPANNERPPMMTHREWGKPSMVWTYRDHLGETLFYIARYDPEGERKQYLPWTWDTQAQRWTMKAWPEPRPLYGLDVLAAKPNARVLVVEGEKAADAAAGICGDLYAVVSWPGGAAAWEMADWSALQGRKVLLWPDADRHTARTTDEARKWGINIGTVLPIEAQPGIRAMTGIATILHSTCEEVKIIDPGIEEKRADGWDAADAINSGWMWAEFAAWAKPRAKIYKALAKDTGADRPSKYSPTSIRAAWWEGATFRPAILAKQISSEQPFLASPIDAAGIGVFLHAYQDGIFRINGADLARRRTHELLGDTSKPDRIESTVALIKESSKIEASALNPFAMKLISVQNGMLDWRTGVLEPQSPEFRSTFQIAAKFDPDEHSEILNRFLTDVFPQDALLLAEELVGYLMRPTTKFQKAVMLLGDGANGKSTFLSMLTDFLGKDNVSNISLQDLVGNRFTSSELQGKLVNIYADLPSSSLEESDVFKAIVGGDSIKAERKFGQPFKLIPTARLLFSANELPRSRDNSPAYFRRWLIIPFRNRFEGSNAKKDLGESLTTPQARSALLNRAVEGLRRLEDQQEFTACASVLEAGQSYRRQSDPAFEFISERLEAKRGSVLGKTEVYESFKQWAVAAGMHCPDSPTALNQRIVQHFGASVAEKRMHRSGHFDRVWAGLGWKSELGL